MSTKIDSGEIRLMADPAADIADVRRVIKTLRDRFFISLVHDHLTAEPPDRMRDLEDTLARQWNIVASLSQPPDDGIPVDIPFTIERVLRAADVAYESKIAAFDHDDISSFECFVILDAIARYKAANSHEAGIRIRVLAPSSDENVEIPEPTQNDKAIEAIKSEVTATIMNPNIRPVDRRPVYGTTVTNAPLLSKKYEVAASHVASFIPRAALPIVLTSSSTNDLCATVRFQNLETHAPSISISLGSTSDTGSAQFTGLRSTIFLYKGDLHAPWEQDFDRSVTSASLQELITVAATHAIYNVANKDMLVSRTNVSGMVRIDVIRGKILFAEAYGDFVGGVASSLEQLESPISSIELKANSNWPSCNPSFLDLGAGHMLAAIRTANHLIDPLQKYIFFNQSKTPATVTHLATFGPTSSEHFSREVDDSIIKRLHPDIVTIEDARIFLYRDSAYLIANALAHKPHVTNTMVIAELDISAARVTRFWMLRSPTGAAREKNWMPIVRGDELYVLHSFAPVRIFKVTLSEHEALLHEVAAPQPFPPADKTLSGGSAFVPYKGGHLAVTHIRRTNFGMRLYANQFVWISADLSEVRISRPFRTRGLSVEYATGLLAKDGMLSIGIGYDDAHAFIETYDERILKHLGIDLERPAEAKDTLRGDGGMYNDAASHISSIIPRAIAGFIRDRPTLKALRAIARFQGVGTPQLSVQFHIECDGEFDQDLPDLLKRKTIVFRNEIELPNHRTHCPTAEVLVKIQTILEFAANFSLIDLMDRESEYINRHEDVFAHIAIDLLSGKVVEARLAGTPVRHGTQNAPGFTKGEGKFLQTNVVDSGKLSPSAFPMESFELVHFQQFLIRIGFRSGMWGDHMERYLETFRALKKLSFPEASFTRALEVGTSWVFSTYLRENRVFDTVDVTNFDQRAERISHLECPLAGFNHTFRSFNIDIETDQIPVPDGYYDFVLCCEVLEHLDVDPMHMMAEINRSLRVGGCLVLSTPNSTSSQIVGKILKGYAPQFYMQYQKDRDPYRHNFEYAPGQLRILLEASGFTISHFWTADTFSAADLEAVRLLKERGYPTDYRGDNIFVVAHRNNPVRERYPSEIYDTRW
ncbi:glycosyl transferase, group 1 [Burkholderiales bacterium GJ-E10]|nr:glycosyl transferase, group 1 [Burkholderiales bacterium GJ-E10]